jgi:tRNA (guanine-N7-)-methyltransferase
MALAPLDLEKLAGVPDWDAVFGFPGTLELEIGSGKGGFAAGYGAKWPQRRLVALEARHLYAEETRKRVDKEKVQNVLVLQGDAKALCPRLFAPESLDAIHLYFPDPWWKRRHFKRRIVEPGFSRVMLGLLKKGAALHVRTDVEERGVDMLRVLLAAGFANPAGDRFATWDPDEVPTTRERRYLAAGQPVWRLHMTRPA